MPYLFALLRPLQHTMRMRPTPLIWSEEELRYLEPEPEASVRRSLANPLRVSLYSSPSTAYEVTGSSVIHSPEGGRHGNFIDASYQRMLANPLWAGRLRKPHTAKRQARPTGPEENIRLWAELDAATSSDALLMNIFCYPKVLAMPQLPALLGIEPGLEPEFGYRPAIPLGKSLKGRPMRDRTEIDMRLGPLLVEAKLTEHDFQTAPMRLAERYPGFDEVFDRDLLEFGPRGVRSYQLIRGALAAHAQPESRFCVFLDARRPDLIEAWFAVLRTVRSHELRVRLRLVTWQEIAVTLPASLQSFLESMYGLRA